MLSNRSSGTVQNGPPSNQVISLPQISFTSNQEGLVFLFFLRKGGDVITFLLEVVAAFAKRVIASETSRALREVLRGSDSGPPRSVRPDKVDRSSTLSKGCDCRLEIHLICGGKVHPFRNLCPVFRVVRWLGHDQAGRLGRQRQFCIVESR